MKKSPCYNKSHLFNYEGNMSRIRPKILNDFYEWMNSHSTLSEATLQSAHFRQTLFPPC